MNFLPHVSARVLNRPLLLTPERAAEIGAFLDGRLGVDGSALAALAPMANASRDRPAVQTVSPVKGVTVIRVIGTMVNRSSYLDAVCGLVSYEGLTRQLANAVHDDQTSAIVVDLDSGGGEACGCFELAATVRWAAARKPVVALVNGAACSAAYAVASAANRIVISPSSLIGSIGVCLLHVDFSGRNERLGLRPTYVYAGRHKVDAHPNAPLTDEVTASLQEEIDAIYEQFLDCVVAGRPQLSREAARATEARVYLGRAAIAAGLADELGTYDDVVSELRQLHSIGREKVETRSKFTITQADLEQARADGVRAGAAAALARVKSA